MAIVNRRLVSSACAVSAALAGALALAGSAEATAAAAPAFSPPPVNAKFDYQIGAAYKPPTGVTVVSRDRNDAPAPGIYNICYVNAFQVQPDEVTWWQQKHDDLLLRDDGGDYVVDGDWNEILLDTSSAAKRAALADIVGGWFKGCATAGFKAIEPDNIDSYDRSDELLSQSDAVAYLKLLASRAHSAGLAIAQKNTTDLGTKGKAAGLDFAVAEECARYTECGDYASVYGDNVIDIEYTGKSFTKACSTIGPKVSVVRRDVNVTAPGSRTYVYDAC